MKTALVLACDDSFVAYTSVVVRRIARSATERFPIIVVSDGVSDENKRLAQKFCAQISFIEAGQLFSERPFPSGHGFSRASYMRLFLDELLAEFDRAVYLDSDISLLADVSPLLALQPKASPVIAAHDLAMAVHDTYRDRLKISGPYFNAGVSIYDLSAIRTEGIFRNALRYALDNPERCLFAEQDALNVVLDGRWQTLDWRWNAMNYMGDRFPKEPFLRHFAGNKPWALKKAGVERRFVDEWRNDLGESPWSGRFQTRTMKTRLQDMFDPIGGAIENVAKPMLYANQPGPRGNKVRLRRRLANILASIERDAATGNLAKRLDLTANLQ